MKNINIKAALSVFVFLLVSPFAFCQDPIPAAEAQNSEFSWVWGEITKVDTEKNEFVIKYLDYESDAEKDMVLAVDASTNFENTPSLKDIKAGDYASVDYAASADGKNAAKNISIEKPDTPSGEVPIGAPPAAGN